MLLPTKTRSRRLPRRVLLVLGLALVAGWVVPSFFSAERYRRRLEAALERKLMRPVSFGAVSFRLLPRPGFSIENVLVKEDPSFGAEPFFRVDQIDCDLRWRSLWHPELDFAQLHLNRPTFNVVRNSSGEWNVESLLRKSGVASPAQPGLRDAARDFLGELDLDADDARLNFKVGAIKKPFSVTDLRARVTIDSGRRRVRFRLMGTPMRTDQTFSTPSPLELEGEWAPGPDLAGPLEATLRSRRALLYNWIPLITGHNPQIYGVLDSEFHLSGSIHNLRVEGQSRLSQLHRWESLPPSEALTITLYLRGQFDRASGRALVENLDASFAGSRIHLSGSVGNISAAPEIDLVVAIERSRLEDLLGLGGRLSGHVANLQTSGRVDGLLTIQGTRQARLYSGFVNVRQVAMTTPAGKVGVSEVDLKVDSQGVQLAPVKITLAPRVEVLAEGALHFASMGPPARHGHRETRPPYYEIDLSVKSVPLHDLARFAHSAGLRPFEAIHNFDFQGSATGAFQLTGMPWPAAPPVLSGHAELHAAKLFVPGLTRPIDLTRARIEVHQDHIVAEPLAAAMGDTVFTGRLEHQGERKRPWSFDLRASRLSLEEASQWLDAPGHRAPLGFLALIPGLQSLAERRAAGWDFLGALNAQGRFAALAVTYRSVTLGDFRSVVEVSGHIVKLSGATFRAGGGRGEGSLRLDLMDRPAPITADVKLDGARVQNFSAYLSPALRGVRGMCSMSGHFETRGLTREEFSTNLRGQPTVRFRNVSLGGFDPLQAAARATSWGELEPSHAEALLRSAVFTFEIRDRSVMLMKSPIEIAGGKIELSGHYGFDGSVEVSVRTDFRRLARRWMDEGDVSPVSARVADFHLAGSLDKLAIAPEVQASREPTH